MQRNQIGAVLVAVTFLAGASVHALGGVGTAQASVTGGTALQQTTIEGTGQTGVPSAITLTTSGSYDWEHIDAYDAQVTIAAGESHDDDAVFAREEYTLDGQNSTEATFANVSGDLLDANAASGWGPNHFMQDFDGESKSETVPVTVRVNVCEYDVAHGDDGCVAFTETHDVTVTIHNEPSEPESNATVSGSTDVSGDVSFTTPTGTPGPQNYNECVDTGTCGMPVPSTSTPA